MNDYVQPEQATSALAEIGLRQERVIDAALVPGWYWWTVAVAMVAIGAAADTKSGLVLGIVIPVAALVIAGLTVSMIFGVGRGARVRSSELLGDRGALAIVGFVWLIVAVTLGLGFGLRALGAPAPATIATVIGGAALVACGPVLMRRLRQIMLGNRSGVTR